MKTLRRLLFALVLIAVTAAPARASTQDPAGDWIFFDYATETWYLTEVSVDSNNKAFGGLYYWAYGVGWRLWIFLVSTSFTDTSIPGSNPHAAAFVGTSDFEVHGWASIYGDPSTHWCANMDPDGNGSESMVVTFWNCNTQTTLFDARFDKS